MFGKIILSFLSAFIIIRQSLITDNYIMTGYTKVLNWLYPQKVYAQSSVNKSKELDKSKEQENNKYENTLKENIKETNILRKALGMKVIPEHQYEYSYVLSGIKHNRPFVIQKTDNMQKNQPVLYNNYLTGFISEIFEDYAVVKPLTISGQTFSVIGEKSQAIALINTQYTSKISKIKTKLFGSDITLQNEDFMDKEQVLTWQGSELIPSGICIGEYDSKKHIISAKTLPYSKIHIVQIPVLFKKSI